jgi:hypothetical protein
MKFLPKGAKPVRHPVFGDGYSVAGPDNSEEFYRFAWQATARVNGWTPPLMSVPEVPQHAPAVVDGPRPSGSDPTQTGDAPCL